MAKIVMLGAGAMGGLFGGLCAEAGHDVWLLEIRPDIVRAVNARGLWLKGLSGDRNIKQIVATDSADRIGPAEIVFVFVKATATEAAVSQALALFNRKTIVVTLQNGLGNVEKIAAHVPTKRIIAGATTHGATLVAPGRIRHAGSGATIIGRPDGKIDAHLTRLAELLNQAGIETTVSPNISGVIWDKLLVNVGVNALTALTRLRNGQLLDFPETAEIMDLAVQEALLVARAKGIELLHADPVAHTRTVCELTTANQSSMLQDILHHRLTEIDVINGAIVREGQKFGIPTPVNTVLANLIAVIEKIRNERDARDVLRES
jgi:2-dehydropantoate 2-reductase